MRLFQLVRDVDISGTSGTGIVAQGVQFDDGTCALRWLTDTSSTGFYNSIEDLIFIHGHEGATNVSFYEQFLSGSLNGS
jgi:hypothetical protein